MITRLFTFSGEDEPDQDVIIREKPAATGFHVDGAYFKVCGSNVAVVYFVRESEAGQIYWTEVERYYYSLEDWAHTLRRGVTTYNRLSGKLH